MKINSVWLLRGSYNTLAKMSLQLHIWNENWLNDLIAAKNVIFRGDRPRPDFFPRSARAGEVGEEREGNAEVRIIIALFKWQSDPARVSPLWCMGVEFRPHRPAAATPTYCRLNNTRRRVQSAGLLARIRHWHRIITSRASERCLPVMIHAHYEYQILGKRANTALAVERH